MAEPLLVVGLGNPGPNYATTRHNLGFMVADLLADRMGEKFKVHKKSGAEVVTGRLAGRPVVLAKPRVYMNESGPPGRAAGQVLLGAARRRRHHPRRTRHRLRPHPAEVRRRRRGSQRVCARWHRRWAPTTSSGSVSASAVRRAARSGAAFVLENFTAAERARGPGDLRTGCRRNGIAARTGPRAGPEHRARLGLTGYGSTAADSAVHDLDRLVRVRRSAWCVSAEFGST